jgi:hypothetical protein
MNQKPSSRRHDSTKSILRLPDLEGHVSVQTTERYLGCKQRIRSAVNDRMVEPAP